MLTGSLLLAAAPAAADAALVDADPGDGEVLTTAPSRVTLTFSGDLLQMGAHALQVTGPDGQDVTDGDLEVEPTTIAVPVAIPGDGVYDVVWQTVAKDGHPVSGRYQFGVGEVTVTPGAADAGDEHAEDEHAEAASDAPFGSPLAVPIIVGALVLAALAGAVIWVVHARGKRP
jgi:methionine-rich copper-binding protein CopC